MRKSAALMIAAGLATAAVGVIPQAEARPWGWGGGWGRSGSTAVMLARGVAIIVAAGDGEAVPSPQASR